MMLTETYATRHVTSDVMIAMGIERVGFLASSPVVAMMSKPMNA